MICHCRSDFESNSIFQRESIAFLPPMSSSREMNKNASDQLTATIPLTPLLEANGDDEIVKRYAVKIKQPLPSTAVVF